MDVWLRDVVEALHKTENVFDTKVCLLSYLISKHSYQSKAELLYVLMKEVCETEAQTTYLEQAVSCALSTY